jgi:NAD(P)-dependent dehydrogenase (short-subunit alcohol dehydrogenase family)
MTEPMSPGRRRVELDGYVLRRPVQQRRGVFHVLKHGVPHLNDGGSVIITSSVVGLVGFGDLSA